MLGLGASDLALISSNRAELASNALIHRVKAVSLFNQAMKTPSKDNFEADARFATLMVLTFQSSCMPDGFYDFLTMLRGCVLHGGEVIKNESCFITFWQMNHLNTMVERFTEAQVQSLDHGPLDEATESLAQLKPYCQPGVEERYHQILCELVEHAYTSPKDCKYTPKQSKLLS